MCDILPSQVFGGPSCQSDELEALYAIYNEDFMFIEPENNIYAIRVSASSDDDDDDDHLIVFQFQYPKDYPEEKMIYQIQAPWLRGPSFDRLNRELDQYMRHTGDEPIVHCLVECIREFLNSDENSDETGVVVDGDVKLEMSNPIEHLTSPMSGGADNVVPPVRAHLNWLPNLMPVATDSEDVLIHHGEPFVDRKSSFQAHLCRAHSVGQVSKFISIMLTDRKVAMATHNILAWRIVASSTSQAHTIEQVHSDCDDDGETHAGSRLLHLLTVSGAKNVCVMVSRWYGGIQLGPDRFKHINNMARKLLCSQQIIGSLSPSSSSKGGRGGRSSKQKK